MQQLGSPQTFKNQIRGEGSTPSTCHSYQIKLVALVTFSLGRIWDCQEGWKNWGMRRVWGLEKKMGRDSWKRKALGTGPQKPYHYSRVSGLESGKKASIEGRSFPNSSGTCLNSTLKSRGTFQK